MADDILKLAEKFAAAAAKRDAQVQARIARAYLSMYSRLAGQVEALAQQVGSGAMTTGQLARLSRYNALMRQIESELNAFAAYTKVELTVSAEAAVARALSDSRSLVTGATASAGVEVAFNTLPRSAVIRLLGFLADNSPLYARIEMMSPVNAEAIRKAFIEGVGLGWNPRKIIAVNRKLFGANLTDALRMVRTANNYAYREATRASYVANEDVVSGWYWLAAINNPNTCIACISKHGKFYPNTQRLNDHHNGRCAMVPAVKGFPNPVSENGQTWFGQQSEADQIGIMGREYHSAWKQGYFSLDEISRNVDNDVYGPMHGVRPLWDLLGAEPPVRMK